MKKIFLMLFTIFGLASPAFAGEYFIYLDSGFQVEAMQLILNAIAMIFGNDEYVTLLRLVTLFGFFIYFVKNVVIPSADGGGGKGLQGLAKYVLGYVALLSIVFSQGATVIIKTNNLNTYYDNHIETYGIAVDNVPEVLAYTYSFLDRMEKSLTNLFEITYGTSNSYKIGYQGYGASFRDVSSVLDIKTSAVDKTIDEDVDNLMSNCIYIPFSASQDGRDEIEGLRKSDDIVGYLDNLYGSGKIINGVDANDFTTEHSGDIYECGNLWTGNIKPRLLALAPQLAKTVKLDVSDMQLLSQDHNPAVPISGAEQAVLQASMVNALKNNNNLGVGIPSATSAAVGKTSSQFILEGVGKSEFFKDMLPFLQRFLELLLIALFPMIVVMALLPGGYEIIKNYTKTLLWVKMWGVTASVVNAFILLSAQSDIKPLVDGGGFISYYNASILLTEAGKWAGIAGLVYAAIPMLTWKIMTGAFSGLESLTGNMAGAMAKNMSTAGTAADAQMMRTKDEVSKQVGHDVSYAEAMNYKAIQAGISDGSSIGTNYNMGENAQRNLNNYNNLNPYNQLKAKQDVVPGGVGGVLDFEKEMLKRKTTGDKAYVDNTTLPDAGAAGLDKALNERALNKTQKDLPLDKIENSKVFALEKPIIQNNKEEEVLKEKGGVQKNLENLTEYENSLKIENLNEKMNNVPGKNISDVVKVESTNEGLNINKKEGFNEVADPTKLEGAGKYDAAVANGTGAATNKNGSNMVENNTKNQKNEEMLKADERFKQLDKSFKNVDDYFRSSSATNVATQELPQYRAFDKNNDGFVSKSEWNDGKKTMTDDAKLNISSKIAKQDELKRQDAQLKEDQPVGYQNAVNSSPYSGLGGQVSNNYNTQAGENIKTFDNEAGMKEKEQLRDFSNPNKIGNTKAAEAVEKVNKVESEAETQQQVQAENKGLYDDVYKKRLEEAHQNGLSGNAAVVAATKAAEHDMHGVQDRQNNSRMYNAKLQERTASIREEKASLMENGDPRKQFSQMQAGLKKLESSPNVDKNFVNNYKEKMKEVQQKAQKLNTLEKKERNIKHDVQQEMVKGGNASISNGKFYLADENDKINKMDKDDKLVDTMGKKGANAGDKTTNVTPEGYTQELTDNKTGKDVSLKQKRAGKNADAQYGDSTTAVLDNATPGMSESDKDKLGTGLNVVQSVSNLVQAGKDLVK